MNLDEIFFTVYLNLVKEFDDIVDDIKRSFTDEKATDETCTDKRVLTKKATDEW